MIKDRQEFTHFFHRNVVAVGDFLVQFLDIGEPWYNSSGAAMGLLTVEHQAGAWWLGGHWRLWTSTTLRPSVHLVGWSACVVWACRLTATRVFGDVVTVLFLFTEYFMHGTGLCGLSRGHQGPDDHSTNRWDDFLTASVRSTSSSDLVQVENGGQAGSDVNNLHRWGGPLASSCEGSQPITV